jgi:hypothetical protein
VRLAVTLVSLGFICAMAFGTVYVLMTEGPDLISGIGVLIVALLAFGVLGALSEPADRRRKRR